MSVGDFIEVEVEGLKELEDNLSQLPEDLAKKVLRAAARKAMQSMRDRVAANTPRGSAPLKKGRTVRLAEGILMSATLRSDGVKGASILVRVGLRVRPKEQSVFYGRFLEFGTAKMAARPFMRPAFDTEKENVLRAFAIELEKGIETVARKAKVKLI